MKKETIIAIVFGIFFGGLVAVFLLTKNKQMQLTRTKTIAPTGRINKLNKTQAAVAKSLEITDPPDGFMTDKDVVTISGKADKGGLIIVQSATKDLVFRNENERFNINLPLSLGENVINVTFYSKGAQSRIQERELRVYYLTEEL